MLPPPLGPRLGGNFGKQVLLLREEIFQKKKLSTAAGFCLKMPRIDEITLAQGGKSVAWQLFP
jgi:hypothetical protein